MLRESIANSMEDQVGMVSSGNIPEISSETEALLRPELESSIPDRLTDTTPQLENDSTNNEIEILRKNVTSLVHISRSEIFDQDQAPVTDEQRLESVKYARQMLLYISMASIYQRELDNTGDIDVIDATEGFTRYLLERKVVDEEIRQQILDFFTEASVDLAGKLGIAPESMLNIQDISEQLGLTEYEADPKKTSEYWLEELSPLAVYAAEARQPQEEPDETLVLALQEREEIEANANFLANQCKGKQFIDCLYKDQPRIKAMMRARQDRHYADAAKDIANHDFDKVKDLALVFLPYNHLYNQMLIDKHGNFQQTPSIDNLRVRIGGSREWQMVEDALVEKERHDQIAMRAVELIAELKVQPEVFQEMLDMGALEELMGLEPSGKRKHSRKT